MNYKISKLIEKIKKFWNAKTSDNIFECLNCGEKFDGIRVDYFIKHQLDYKHWDARKYKKEEKEK